MNLISIFELPQECLQDIRLSKKMLLEQPDITVSEAKLISNPEVRSIHIFGIVSLEKGNVAPYEDQEVSYIEIYFIRVLLSETDFAKTAEPVAQLLHKLIPHDCVVLLQPEEDATIAISLAQKRISKNSPDLRVIEKMYFAPNILESPEFMKQCAFAASEKLNQKMYYEYLIKQVLALQNVALTGMYEVRSLEVGERLTHIQKEIKQLEAAIASKRRELTKDTQMAEKVEINTAIHHLKQEVEDFKKEVSQLTTRATE